MEAIAGMLPVLIGIGLCLMGIILGIGLCIFYLYSEVRKWKGAALKYKAFIENPNVKARDKETEYKNTYQAKLNALDNERRNQLETMTEVFDFINDNAPFSSHQEGLMQCRNRLLVAIQNSTYGRADDGNVS